MKVLFVNTHFGFWGGVEKYIYEMARLLKQEGWHISGYFENHPQNDKGFREVFDTCYVDDPEQRETVLKGIAASGVQIAIIHKISNSVLADTLNRTFKTVGIIHDHDYYCIRRHKYFPLNRINCHLPFNRIYCSLCAGLLEKKPGHSGKIGILNTGNRVHILNTVRKMDRWIVLSEYMKNNMVQNGFDADKVWKIYPVMNSPESLPVSSSHPVPILLFSGQIIKGKGLDLLIEALAQVSRAFILKVAGQGNDIDFVKQRVNTLKLTHKVEFLGWVSDVKPYYQECDVVVVPSRWQEPFGLIGPEAFSWGKPVIGFNTGGIGEWLHDRVNGLLIPEKDIRAMAEGLTFLIDNPDIRQQWGINGFDYVRKEYNNTLFMNRFNQLMENVNV